MKKPEIDQLYHLLRQTSNISEEQETSIKTCLTPQEQVNVIYGLCRHLLAGGDYIALVQFSQFYGSSYLIEPTFWAIKDIGWHPERIVDLGAGLGWLGRGLAAKFGMLPTLLVDKRPWSLINLVADLETDEGLEEILNELRDGDLIVACDLLHCLDSPREIMTNFSRWPTAILEYYPVNAEFRKSYSNQLQRYGACSFPSYIGIKNLFPDRQSNSIEIDPYVLLLVDPVTKESKKED